MRELMEADAAAQIGKGPEDCILQDRTKGLAYADSQIRRFTEYGAPYCLPVSVCLSFL